MEETLLSGGASAPGLAAFERVVRCERLPEDGRRYREIRARRTADPYEELNFTAAEIARLVREEGLRYREIAVIARDLSRYDVALPAVFERYRIPCFLDLRTDACSSALTQGVLTAAAVAGGLREGDPLQLAASPLTGLSAGELGALENYCYVWSVRGRGWEQPFVNHPDGMVGPLDGAGGAAPRGDRGFPAPRDGSGPSAARGDEGGGSAALCRGHLEVFAGLRRAGAARGICRPDAAGGEKALPGGTESSLGAACRDARSFCGDAGGDHAGC